MRIGVVGLGLIGGSLAAAWRVAGHRVSGFDVDPHAVHAAGESGWIDSSPTLDELLSSCEVVVLATPPATLIASLSAIGTRVGSGVLLTDVCSVKRPVIAAMDALPDSVVAVGGHPMAGKARGGVDNADPNLFCSASYAVVPSVRSSAVALDVISSLARDLGAQPVIVEADVHDQVVAATSHVPQLLSTALGASLTGVSDDGLRGPALAGMLRLASSDAQLWTEILSLNRDEVLLAMDRLMRHLIVLRDAVAIGDSDSIRAEFLRAAEAVV